MPAIIAGLPIERYPGRAPLARPDPRDLARIGAAEPARVAHEFGGRLGRGPETDRRNVLLSPSRSEGGALPCRRAPACSSPPPCCGLSPPLAARRGPPGPSAARRASRPP